MSSPRRVDAPAAAAAAAGGDGKKAVDAAWVSDTGRTAPARRKGMSLPSPPNCRNNGIGSTSRAAEGRTNVITARGTAPQVAESASSPSISSRKSVGTLNCGISFSRTRHTVASRQSLYKSVKFGSPALDCHPIRGPLREGGPPATARGMLGQAAAAHDQGIKKGEHTLTFESRLVLRHGEYWTGKLSARRDAEVPPEILCAEYSALQQTLFVGLSTGVLLVWRSPFVAGRGQPEPASLVIKAREHTGAICALAYHRKLEADRTPHHFQALQQLQGAQIPLPAPKNWETLPPWSTGNGRQQQQQQQQQAGTAAAEDQRVSTTAARPTGMLLSARDLGVRDSEDYSGVLFTGSADRCVKVWFVHEKKVKCVKTLCVHGGTVVALAYCSPLLFSSSTDGTVLICRVDTAASTLKHPQFTPVQRIFTHQSYHPYSVVASLGSEASVAVVDPLTAQVWWQNANPEGYCYSAFTWMPAFNLLLVGDEGGNLSFYNVYSRERVYSQQVTTSKIVTLGPGQSSLQVLAGTAHEFLVIDVVETTTDVQLEGHIGTVTNLYVRETAEGTYLYSAGDDHSIRVWDPVRGLCCRVVRHKHADITRPAEAYFVPVPYRDDTAHKCSAVSWLFMESLGGLVTGHEDGDVRFWTLKEFSSFSIHNTKGHRMHTNSVASMCCWPLPEIRREEKMTNRQDRQGELPDAIHGDGVTDKPIELGAEEAFHVLSCGYDGRLNVFELRIDRDTGEVSTKQVDQLARSSNKTPGNGEEILCCTAFPNDNAFFTAGNSSTITKWSAKSLTVDGELDGHQSVHCTRHVSKDTREATLMHSVHVDRGFIQLTFMDAPQPVECIHRRLDAITALCKAADHLLSGSADLSVRVWTVEPPHCIRVIKTQSDPAACLISFEHSSETFWASMTWPGEISVWDVKWHLLASRKFQTAMNCFACSESLKLLFLGTDEGVIMTTPLPPCQKLTIIEKGRVTVGVSFQAEEGEKASQAEKVDSEAVPD